MNVWLETHSRLYRKLRERQDALTLAEADAIKAFDTYWTDAESDIAILEKAEEIKRDWKRFSASEKVTQTILKPGTCRVCFRADVIRYGKCFKCTFNKS